MAPGGRSGRGGNRGGRSTSNARTNHEPGNANAPNCDETTHVAKRVRGPSKGLAAEKIIKATGSKLKVHFAPGDNSPSGENHALFTAEIGIVIRHHAPLQVQSWNKILESEKKTLIERVMTKFEADTSDAILERYIRNKMCARYNDNKSEFHTHFKKMATVEEARRNKPERITTEDWEYLRGLFSDEKFKNRSRKCSENRSLLPFNHCGGSKSFVQHQYEDAKGNILEEPKGEIQLFHDTHFTAKNGWVGLVSKLHYETMVELQTSEENEMSEAEICAEVLGKKCSYVKGRGFGPLPESSKSRHSQGGTRADTEELRSEVLHLKELLAANQTRNEAILKKFQEFVPDYQVWLIFSPKIQISLDIAYLIFLLSLCDIETLEVLCYYHWVIGCYFLMYPYR